MLLARRYRFPMSPFNELQREFGRLFNNVLSDFDACPVPRRAAPGINVWEAGDNFYAEAEVPGLGMDDLEVFVVGNELTIKGRWNAERDDDQRVFHRRERQRGAFTRVLTLPVDLDAEKVNAVLKDGVLTVTLPKAETARTRKIAVKSA
ncbi:MAG: Hsp20/alpha crystallin family protein [Planctomycetes bacterium]|nr:Hsp20/alpha crystallin family protein [Planctomycetota bacterium]